jgi:hypothetical protein
MSRSQFYVVAVKAFLQAHSQKEVTERLDEVYGKAESKVDPVLSAMQISAARTRDAW